MGSGRRGGMVLTCTGESQVGSSQGGKGVLEKTHWASVRSTRQEWIDWDGEEAASSCG